MKLSILIPSIPERREKALSLYDKLIGQIGKRQAEVLLLVDNRRRSIGQKRDALVQIAKGYYLCFVDDDDDISDNYISKLFGAISEGADCISFESRAVVDGKAYEIDHSIHHQNEQLHEGKTLRQPFQMCLFKTHLAQLHRFKDVGYGEDWDWCKRVLRDIKTEVHIPKILYLYNFNSDLTSAPKTKTEVNKGGANIRGKLQILK